MKQIAIFFIRCYQWVFSPFVGMHCRFNPSCSHYAIQAINRFGAVKGGYLAVRRLLRCHPWHEGGHDPVPERKK